MKTFQLILFTFLIFCNSTNNSSKNRTMVDSKQNTITLKFKVEKMLGVGWGTVYVAVDVEILQGNANIPDSLGIYVAVGNIVKTKINLNALKTGEYYSAKFTKSINKSDKSYMPAGTTGFILANRDIWHLQSIQKSMENRKITITGTALNAKLGAIIQTEKGEVFFLDGIYEWPDDVFGKKVKATGLISSEYHDPKNLITDDGLHKTGMSGEKQSLQNAKWELIDK